MKREREMEGGGTVHPLTDADKFTYRCVRVSVCECYGKRVQKKRSVTLLYMYILHTDSIDTLKW